VRTQSESVKEHIGYMSQRFSLYDDLSVEENIDFFGGIYRIPPGKKRERKEWAIRMAGLEGHLRTRAAHLSGGWKQRLALGCAILHEPPVLFLDEPTAGTDPISRRGFWDLIYSLSGGGTTVLVTTHSMDEAEHCDRLAFVYRGELVAMGSPGELKAGFATAPAERAGSAAPSLEEVFVAIVLERDRRTGPVTEVRR
jgi:ABC-2 type transport system ATP-binding protein